MKDPWIQTITRPTAHLVATCIVAVLVVACVVLSVLIPEWLPLFGLAAGIPAVMWYLHMMKVYKQNKAQWLQAMTPPAN